MRRHLLPVAPVEGLRPTPDRVRETLFNWLGQDCTGFQVLDLFSGTGALGFEAASRGAASVQFVESHTLVCRQLLSNRDLLLGKWPAQSNHVPEIHVHQGSVHSFLKADHSSTYDVIFMDPPFASEHLQATLPLIKHLLKPSGVVYIEWGEPLFNDLSALEKAMQVPEIEALRHIRAGQVHAHLLALPAV